MSAPVLHLRRPRWLPLVGGLLVLALAFQLGNWQLRRAAEKEAAGMRIERLAEAGPLRPQADGHPAEWATVVLDGAWEARGTIYLDNRTHGGRAGYHVLTPLRLADGSGVVLVNRGWIAAGLDRTQLPPVPLAGTPGELAGIVRFPEAAPFTLAGEPASGELWQYLDLERYRAWSGLQVAGWVVQQTSAAHDGLVRDWPRPDSGADRHRGYALQWYGLALLAMGLTAWYLYHLIRSAWRDEQSPDRPCA